MLLRLLLPLAVMALVTGCPSKKKTPKEYDAPGSSATPQTVQPQTTTTNNNNNGGVTNADGSHVLSSNLQGMWASKCLVNAENKEEKAGFLTEYDFSGPTLYFTTKTFTDRKCATPAATVMTTLDYMLGQASTDVPGAYLFDTKISAMTMQLHSEDMVKAYNAQKACGVSTWSLNVPVDVSQSLVCNPGLNRTNYGLIQIINTRLAMSQGDQTRDGSSPEKRTTIIDAASSVERK